jgi:hypothetical protein
MGSGSRDEPLCSRFVRPPACRLSPLVTDAGYGPYDCRSFDDREETTTAWYRDEDMRCGAQRNCMGRTLFKVSWLAEAHGASFQRPGKGAGCVDAAAATTWAGGPQSSWRFSQCQHAVHPCRCHYCRLCESPIRQPPKVDLNVRSLAWATEGAGGAFVPAVETVGSTRDGTGARRRPQQHAPSKRGDSVGHHVSLYVCVYYPLYLLVPPPPPPNANRRDATRRAGLDWTGL